MFFDVLFAVLPWLVFLVLLGFGWWFIMAELQEMREHLARMAYSSRRLFEELTGKTLEGDCDESEDDEDECGPGDDGPALSLGD